MLDLTPKDVGPARRLSPAGVAVLAALLIAIVGTWQVYRAREAALADAGTDVRSLASALAQHGARTFEAVDLALTDLVDRIEANGVFELSSVSQLSAKKAKILPQVRDITVFDADGNALLDLDLSRSDLGSVAKEPLFIWHRDNADRGLHFDQVFERGSPQLWSIPLSRRWNRADGSFGGVVLATLSPEHFQSFYDRLGVDKQGSISLVTASGRVLVRHPFDVDAINFDFSGTPVYRDLLPRSSAGSFQLSSPIDGIERIGAYEQLDVYPLVVFVARSVSETLAPWAHDAAIQGGVLSLAVIGLLVLAFALARRDTHLRAANRARDWTEDLLAEKGALLEATLENMDQGLIAVGSDGRIELWNRRALRLLDLPAEFMATGPTSAELLDYQASTGEFDLNDESTRSAARALGGMEGSYVYERRRPNGIVLEVRTRAFTSGRVVRTYTDITARHEADAALRASDFRYRNLVESMSDVITHISLPDLRRVYVSPACRTLFGCEPEEMMGLRPTASIIHPDDAASVREAADRLIHGDVAHNQATYRARHKAGHWIWVEASLSLVRAGPGGEPSMLVCLLRDVSERVRRSEELEDAKTEAEAASRTKAEFLATISHEIRTPLNGIIGFSRLALEDTSRSTGEPPLGPVRRRFIELVQDASAALLVVVNDVLDTSKIEAGGFDLDPQPFDLRRAIENTVAIVRNSAEEKGLRLVVEIDRLLPLAVVSDETRIRQILLNLLTNAIKFTAKGEVSLRVDAGLGSSDLRHSLVRFAIGDTGIGIPEAKHHRLFKRFSQVDQSTSRRFGGSGLGLAISKRIVDALGGTIGVESQDGCGSTFWFELSLEIADQALPADAITFDAPAADRPLRILLAEDIDVNREIVQATLERVGHTVEVACDGVAALDAVQGSVFDVVLMDIQMPNMGGLEATDRIRALGPAYRTLPIIALSANVLSEEVARFHAAGMDDHIGKPFDPSELLAKVARWAGRRPSRIEAREEAARPAAAPIFDEARYASLRLDFEEAALSSLLGKLQSRLVERLDGLSACAAEGDAEKLAQHAHTVASSAGLVGFAALSDLCGELERAAHGGQPIDDPLLRLSKVRAATERKLAELIGLAAAA